MPALHHPSACHRAPAVSPPSRAEGKLHQMLQKGARKGRFRLRVLAAAEGNWQPAGDGLEVAAEEGTAKDRSRGGPGGADVDGVPLGWVRGTGLVPEPKWEGEEKIQIRACKGFVQSCPPHAWLLHPQGGCQVPSLGLGDAVQGSGDPG